MFKINNNKKKQKHQNDVNDVVNLLTSNKFYTF